MHGIRRETVYSNSAGWGTSRYKRKIETHKFCFTNYNKKEIQERHLMLETIE